MVIKKILPVLVVLALGTTCLNSTLCAMSLKRALALLVAAASISADRTCDARDCPKPDSVGLVSQEFASPTLRLDQISVTMPFDEYDDQANCRNVEGRPARMDYFTTRITSSSRHCTERGCGMTEDLSSGRLACPHHLNREPVEYCFSAISHEQERRFRQLIATEPCKKISEIIRAQQLRCMHERLGSLEQFSSAVEYSDKAAESARHCMSLLLPEPTPVEVPDISTNNHGDITLVTIATPNRAAFADITERNQQAYADRHGYNFAKFTRTLDSSRPEEWSKIKALYNVLRNPDFAHSKWLLWIDDDIMITSPRKTLESFIAKHADEETQIIIAQDAHSERGVPINNGIFLIRNSDWSKDFLHRVWLTGAEKGYLVRGGSLLEQATMTYLFKFEPERAVILPTRAMNSFLRDTDYQDPDDKVWQPGDFAAHATGMPASLRTCIIKRLEQDPSQTSCKILTACDKDDRRECPQPTLVEAVYINAMAAFDWLTGR